MKKNQQLLWDLYAGIAKDANKNQRLLCKLYAGIARNLIKTQRIPWIDIIVVTYEIRVFFEDAQKEVFSSIFKKTL